MIALSFSGGKDSSLALYQLQQSGKKVSCLFTTVWKENDRTIAHEESTATIQAQAKRLNIPIHFIYTTFETYGEDFVRTLIELKKQYNLTSVAFGDWYLEEHRTWGEEQAAKAQLEPLYPLWAIKDAMVEKLYYFIELGFKAQVIKIDEQKLPEDWVGRMIDKQFIDDIVAYEDVCPMGEHGEYHTTVVDGPIY